METKFNFKSSVCTSREQSRRLLALGLKPETADMCHMPFRTKVNGEALDYTEHCSLPHGKDIPAWSLHRLIEMMPRTIKANDDLFFLLVSKEDVFYDNTEGTAYSSFINRNGLYYNIILCIEWLIKEGYFNKEYLVDLTGTDSHQDMVDSFRYAFEALKKED